MLWLKDGEVKGELLIADMGKIHTNGCKGKEFKIRARNPKAKKDNVKLRDYHFRCKDKELRDNAVKQLQTLSMFWRYVGIEESEEGFDRDECRRRRLVSLEKLLSIM